MAVLAHLLRSVPAARRAYSVFSKPGGGRYFNSAKPPKVAPATTKGKVDVSSSSGDAPHRDQSTQQSPGSPSVVDEHPLQINTLSMPLPAVPVHPTLNPHDLKLHQFFSLHRPLLLVSHPVSSVFESASQFLTSSAAPRSQALILDGYEGSPEASPEEDADAARQLARALVINRVGPSLLWDDTLQTLGLDMAKGRAEEVKLAETEFEVYMDSTKRKRRKKMKKHKLRKRRRLSRAQRVKIGR
ncbi:uncharacterized protein FIBRA_02041 [Fibroporia radiculosa]|uniref:Small ribosomal subunit protein mS38 n=1 Tax=Fibroporia radiculosa TaxID=599839 RepID=J4GM72_9APHY|nr:uncharacterized protein FIBRA_02041 [Fibroporia radiculosa]CCM00015.1 predicted protein [Fibroporia radiculosa]